MNFRKRAAGLFCLMFCICLLCGCGTRQVPTVDDFSDVLSEKGFEIVDVTEQARADYVRTIRLAVQEDYQIEFYILDNKDAAESVWEQSRSVFEESAGKVNARISKNIANYSFFSLQSGGMYCVVARIDNTVVYAVAEEKYRKEIEGIIKELGY